MRAGGRAGEFLPRLIRDKATSEQCAMWHMRPPINGVWCKCYITGRGEAFNSRFLRAEGYEMNAARLMRTSTLKAVLAGALVASALVVVLALTVTGWVAAAGADVNASNASGAS